jgi:phenylalanyl-tRNA synthetase beta subunit
MSKTTREIESLRARIAKLEQQRDKEEQEREALENTHSAIFEILDKAGLSLEAFLRHNYKAVKRLVGKVEKEEAKAAVQAPITRKKTTTKKKSRRKAARKKATIKIPAGQYKNIPSDPEKVFEVKDKGPRPKALKAYAEELGLDEFLKQCRVD